MPRITTRIQRFSGFPALVPARERDFEELRVIEEKGGLQTTILPYTKADALRDYYWGLVTLVADGLGISKDDLHAQLKFKAGFIHSYVPGPTGPIAIVKSIARPISLAKLRAYVDVAIEIIFIDYLPGVRRQDVIAEVERRVGPRPR